MVNHLVKASSSRPVVSIVPLTIICGWAKLLGPPTPHHGPGFLVLVLVVCDVTKSCHDNHDDDHPSGDPGNQRNSVSGYPESSALLVSVIGVVVSPIRGF